MIRIAKILTESLVNGEGIRLVLFMSGCELNCKGCHNIELQNPAVGEDFEVDDIINKVRNNISMIDGITLSGGDPIYQYESSLELCKKFKLNFPNKTIWIYTGKLFSEIKSKYSEILEFADVIVDGPYVEDLKCDDITYKGSSNQNIIEINNNK